MSSYQYYEYIAVDRTLSKLEISELRAVSKEAQITPSSFVDEYIWGDFHGDPTKVLERYFDVFVYVANWGSYRIAFRLPANSFDEETLKQYCTSENTSLKRTSKYVIIDVTNHSEKPDDCLDCDAWMKSLAGLRAELLQGDWRPLYLIWLSSAQRELANEQVEPTVPKGLDALTEAQQKLVAFLGIDQELVSVAAEKSKQVAEEHQSADLLEWVHLIPDEEKDQWLLEVIQGNASQVQLALRHLYQQEIPDADFGSSARRTVGELIELGQGRRQEQEHIKQEQGKVKRKQQLKALSARQHEVWEEIEDLVSSKNSKSYEQAVSLLVDLQEIAQNQRNQVLFCAQLAALKEFYSNNAGFSKRLSNAGL
jgi:hypothetical protein